MRRLRLVPLLVHAVLLTLSAAWLVPLAWMACTAVKRADDQFRFLFLPTGRGAFGVAWDRLTLDHFLRLFEEARIGVAMLNSVFVSSVSAVIATVACAAAGFALARYEFRGRRIVTLIVFGALIVPPPLLLAPTYELLYHLSMLDTFAGLLLPGLVPAFGVYLFREAAAQSVPPEMLEAARIDGCGEVRAFFSIALPLMRPMTGAFIMIVFLMWWNNFIAPQVVMQSPDNFPLAVAITQLRGVYYQDYGMQMAATFVSVAPLVVLFLLLQRELIAGLTAGAVKS